MPATLRRRRRLEGCRGIGSWHEAAGGAAKGDKGEESLSDVLQAATLANRFAQLATALQVTQHVFG